MDAQREWETCPTCGQDVGFCVTCERLRTAIERALEGLFPALDPLNKTHECIDIVDHEMGKLRAALTERE
jgi:hypothetical protein